MAFFFLPVAEELQRLGGDVKDLSKKKDPYSLSAQGLNRRADLSDAGKEGLGERGEASNFTRGTQHTRKRSAGCHDARSSDGREASRDGFSKWIQVF